MPSSCKWLQDMDCCSLRAVYLTMFPQLYRLYGINLMWKEEAAAYLKVLSQNLPTEIEENNAKQRIAQLNQTKTS
jgi:hypothetical protein